MRANSLTTVAIRCEGTVPNKGTYTITKVQSNEGASQQVYNTTSSQHNDGRYMIVKGQLNDGYNNEGTP